jgi:hypothetical protein
LSPISQQRWWLSSIIPALGRLKQEDHEFEASLNYIVRPCFKTKRKERKKKKTPEWSG